MNNLPIILLFTLLSTALFGQTTYKNSNESFRTHYFLSFQGESVTFYGCDLTQEKDTVYFEAIGQLDTSRFEVNGILRLDISAKFDDFKFSKVRPNELKLNLLPENGVAIPTLLAYKYMHIKETNGTTIKVIFLKDSYDGRVDEFTFKRID